MGLNVIFSDEANETFESIGQQIQFRWDENEVNEFRKRAYKVVDIISEYPLIFQALNKIKNVRKAYIHKTVLCFTE